MPKSETTIRFTPAIWKELLPVIQDNIPANDYVVSKKVRTGDSTGAIGTIIEISITVITSSPACIAIASIARKWIQTRSSKKITITTEKGTIEVKNLTSKELSEVMDQCKIISFKEE
ncbi:hypothetical protein OGY69_17630 [Citrobacter sp. Cpo086]|uniref:effector-associated constant component EACC1 n=1 Tax=Citrobacter sp. Cpo086 TaxID=2985137 RepID=UPI0025750F8B|nr:hypothetical protein [Citrobacter sp. Cpo086]MDM2840676.1 hypothetical protein [Citrobacter sp. Cpo086]